MSEPAGAGRAAVPRAVTWSVIFVFVAWSLRVALVELDRSVLTEGLRVVIFLGPALLYAMLVRRRNPLRALRLDVVGNRHWLVDLPVLAAIFVGWHAVLASVVLGRTPSLDLAAAVVSGFTLATFVEEVFFRGFLLGAVAPTLGFWPANVASASLFALIHLPGWLAVGRAAAPGPLALDAAGVLALGLACGWVVGRTGSLWPAIVLHAIHNVSVVVWFGAPNG